MLRRGPRKKQDNNAEVISRCGLLRMKPPLRSILIFIYGDAENAV